MTNYNPWPKNLFFKILACIWSSILMIFVLLIVSFLLITKQITNKKIKDGAWEFIINNDSFFYKKIANKFNGFSLGWCIIYTKDGYNNLVTRIHERVHLSQQLKLSIFQWIFYTLFYIFIYLGTDLDPYAANPFEIDARVKSGQNVNFE